jgi:hypothetical protein
VIGCTKDEEHIKNTGNAEINPFGTINPSEVTGEIINWNEFMIRTSLDVNSDIFQNFNIGNSNSSTELLVTTNTDNEELLVSQVQVFVYEDVTTYTFVVLENNEDNSFRNLILRTEDHIDFEAFIALYNPTIEWLNSNQNTTAYEGSVEVYPYSGNYLITTESSSSMSCSYAMQVIWECDAGRNHGPQHHPCIGGNEVVGVNITETCIPSYPEEGGGGDNGGDNGVPWQGGNNGGGENAGGSNEDGTDRNLVTLPNRNIDCSANLNAYYSQSSPFNVDLAEVSQCNDSISTSLVEANEKFMCIYNKLTQSPKFKDLFIDTFGESQELNVSFKISDTLNSNGRCLPNNLQYNANTNEIINSDMQILISKNYIESSSAIAVAKTILHESIHAYLMVKHYGCNQGSPIEGWDDVDLSELLDEYLFECEMLQGQHEFMFNYMIPTMSEILESLKDDLIPQNHQSAAEDYLFINETNPTVDPNNGEYIQDTPWDWDEFFKYLSISGLQNSSAFHFEIGSLNSQEEINQGIDNETPKAKNFIKYAISVGVNMFKKECNE